MRRSNPDPNPDPDPNPNAIPNPIPNPNPNPNPDPNPDPNPNPNPSPIPNQDEMRRIGDVIYADVDELGDGIVEFATLEDLEYAVTPTLSPSP